MIHSTIRLALNKLRSDGIFDINGFKTEFVSIIDDILSIVNK